VGSSSVLKQLDESQLSQFHFKAVVTSGMGFFTDAYDLFIIGVVIVLLAPLWHLNALEISLLGSTALLSAALGSLLFGHLADLIGRKAIYGYELIVLAAGAIASALSPNIIVLLIFRFLLGLGIGGDYPVSATLMSEYANRRDRGKLITMVFSTQAFGLIVGPLIAMLLLFSGLNVDITWRLLLAFGAIPSLATFSLRRQITESPRFALAQGNLYEVSRAIALASGQAPASTAGKASTDTNNRNPASSERSAPHPLDGVLSHPSWQEVLTTRHSLLWITGTAGCWFLLDIAYYGTTVSTPMALKLLNAHATLTTNLFYTLLIFLVAALPGYLMAALMVDRLGRKKLQLLGFAMMTLAYGSLFFLPALTTITLPFLLIYGLSYFFTEFGPNVTTFAYPAEIFPVSVRSTAHGISAAVGKVGAFIGVFVFPMLLASVDLPGAMGFAAAAALTGFLLTFVLPEPDRKSLETIEREGEQLDEELGGKDEAAVEGQPETQR
jgi:PHS family inorganic phosphate transporter-like MFS transporter